MSRWKSDTVKPHSLYSREWAKTPAGIAYRQKHAEYAKQWRMNNSEKRKLIQKRSYDKIRVECFEHYGGAQCRCCGESELRFLHLDHKQGDGAAQRKIWERDTNSIFGGTAFYYWLKKNGFPDLGLQVLCANCNLGKRTGKYCPHELNRGVDMDGNKIPVEELKPEYPPVTRRLRGEAVKEADALGVKPATLRMRRWREKQKQL